MPLKNNKAGNIPLRMMSIHHKDNKLSKKLVSSLFNNKFINNSSKKKTKPKTVAKKIPISIVTTNGLISHDLISGTFKISFFIRDKMIALSQKQSSAVKGATIRTASNKVIEPSVLLFTWI